MTKLRYLIAAIVVLSVASCSTSRQVESSSIELPLELKKSDYEIVSSFRHKSRNKYTYDVVLHDVRKKHGKDVDIVNLKVDKRRKKVVINGYVIRYKK